MNFVLRKRKNRLVILVGERKRRTEIGGLAFFGRYHEPIPGTSDSLQMQGMARILLDLLP